MKFCSEACAYRHKKIDEAHRIRERRALTRVTNCLTCGADVTHRTNKAKCCSKDCYDQWRKTEYREQIIAARRVKYAANLETERERSRRWAAENPERSTAAKVAYRMRNRDLLRERNRVNKQRSDPDGMKARLREQNRRARKLGNPESVGVSPRDWERMIRIYGNRCAYCGGRAEKLTLDHVIPISKGGQHAIGNAVPACGRCNSSKHVKLLAVWRYKYLPLVKEIAA